MTVLDTPRLRLRPLKADDLDALVVHLNDWEISQWLLNPPFPYTHADGRNYIAIVQADHEAGPGHGFAIADRTDDLVIGTIGAHPVRDDAGTGTFGYWVGRMYWGHGYASEAVRELLGHGFGALGYQRLIAYTDPDNRPSQRVLAKAGFRLTGTSRSHAVPTRRGSPLVHVHELLRSEFDP